MNTYDKERHTKDLTFVHVHILISDIFSTNFLNECKILSMTYFMYSAELSNFWRAIFNQKIRQITCCNSSASERLSSQRTFENYTFRIWRAFLKF